MARGTFKEGHEKVGGRKKGTPNKPKPMREKLLAFTEENFDEFVMAWHSIDEPEKKCRIYLDAQQYCLPKMANVQLVETQAEKSFRDELDELSQE